MAIGKPDHFQAILELFSLRFNQSTDGIEWSAVDSNKPIVYEGGISEVGWTYDLDGNVWGVGRNEHGDDSGWAMVETKLEDSIVFCSTFERAHELSLLQRKT